MKRIKIAGRTIGSGYPCFIVAEAGVNHNGNVDLAKKLIDAAKKAGADAVKFQMFSAEKLVTNAAPKAEYQRKGIGETQREMLKKLELGKNDFRILKKYAEKSKIIFLATPFDEENADFLTRLGVPAIKIGSGDLTNLPLLEHVARKNKPIILSTGMGTMQEVREAVDKIKKSGNEKIILLHCVSSYPARLEDSNLRAIQTMEKTFYLPVGYSDHTLGITAGVAAVALGACLIEKHFTLDKKLPGPDHKASLEPDELEAMVARIREVERAMGSWAKRPTKDEDAIKKVVRKSIVAKVNIPMGTVITGEMLELKRPGTGLGPKYLEKVVGKMAKKNIRADELVTLKKLA